MKKLLSSLILTSCSILPATVNAAEATGVIEELKICGTGHGNHKWIRTIQFKVDGLWFGTYADYYSSEGRDYDNSLTSSLLMMAFSQNKKITINATDSWSSDYHKGKCGVSEGFVFHNNVGDYIRFVNQNI
ncbi:hypothetical protein [Neptuniibacter sp. QD34_54]|uniref:hypothetical protein n=1 Tax=Neptuniibacter sp. QD34_54 TaxID=3398208 RepID=UPI0039F5175E